MGELERTGNPSTGIADDGGWDHFEWLVVPRFEVVEMMLPQ